MLTGRATQRRPRLDEEAGETDSALSIPATQLPAPRWAGRAKDVVCCCLRPFKSLLFWVVGVVVAVAVITILIILLINMTPQGSAMIQTFMARITAIGEDKLVEMLDTFGGEMGQILARIHFNSMPVSALVVISASTPTLQGWIEIRRDYVRVSVTVMGLSSWSTLVLAQRQANQSVSLYSLLEHTGGGEIQANAVITCRDPSHPLPHCQRLLEARLAGDHLSLLLLTKPLSITVAGLPPLEDVLLQVPATIAS